MEYIDKIGNKINIGDTVININTGRGGSHGAIRFSKAIVIDLIEENGKVRVWKENDLCRQYSQLLPDHCIVTKEDISLKESCNEYMKKYPVKENNKKIN